MPAAAREHSAPAPDSFLIIDDHPLFCEALSMTLQGMHPEAKVASARSLGEGMERIAEGADPDTILLDLHLPDTDGLDGLVRLRQAHPETPVVVISSVNDAHAIAAAMQAGAAGFIPKDTAREELITAFQKIWSGGTYTPPGYSAPIPPERQGEDTLDVTERLAKLTPQQKRILELICAGKLNKQIAYDLDIAESTVKAHVTAILRKLGTHSRVQALLIAQRAGLGSVLPDPSKLP